VSIIACASDYFGHLYVQDVAIIWVFDLLCLVAIDFIKVIYFNLSEEDTRVLVEVPSPEVALPVHTASSTAYKPIPTSKGDLEAPKSLPVAIEPVPARAESIVTRMNVDAGSRSASSANILQDAQHRRQHSDTNLIAVRKGSSTALIMAQRQASKAHMSPHHHQVPQSPESENVITTNTNLSQGKIVVSNVYLSSGSSTIDLRRNISNASLRPHTPANRPLARK
jgi:hypothetical protein